MLSLLPHRCPSYSSSPPCSHSSLTPIPTSTCLAHHTPNRLLPPAEGSLAKALLLFHSWPRLLLLSALQVPGDHWGPRGAGECRGYVRSRGQWGDSSNPKAGPGSHGDRSQAAISSVLHMSEAPGGQQVFGWRGLYLGYEPRPGSNSSRADGEKELSLCPPLPSSSPVPRLSDAAAPLRAAGQGHPQGWSRGQGSCSCAAAPGQGPTAGMLPSVARRDSGGENLP